MIRAERNDATILVTDAGRGSGVATIRSLGRQRPGRERWRVVAADCDPRSPGFRSRYADHRLLYPSPAAAPREFVDCIEEAVRRERVDLIIPITDESILPLSEARERFDGLCNLAIPDAGSLQVTTNKEATLSLAKQLGVPVPETAVVATVDEAIEAVERFDWPIVLKPLVSRLYNDQASIEPLEVCYANSRDELAERMAFFERRAAVLLQQYVPGTGHGIELLLDQGRPLAAFQHKRLREVPLNGGASAFRESVELDPVLYDYSLKLMQALDWTGLAMVEFKLGSRGPMLMEINGRVWGSLPLAVHSGMDFPVRLADLYLGGLPENGSGPVTSYRVGVRARNLELDVAWISNVLLGKRRYSFLPIPKRREAVAALCGWLNPANKFDILSIDDPGPGLAELPKLFRKIRGKLSK